MILIFVFCFCLLFLKSIQQSPHIIFIIADDLGWNDVSFHGSKQIPTPNIDLLAKDGIVLNNYYVQPICTPSRGALMTGKYPIRLGLQHDVIYADAPWGLSPLEKILPKYLKEYNYINHGIGKWHLGFFNSSYLPTNRGFDSFFGYWTGKKDFYTHFEEVSSLNGLDLHDDDKNAWTYNGYYATELFTNKAKSIIREHNCSQPLFLYLAHQAVHAGNSYATLQAPPEYVKPFSHIKDGDRRLFAGMVSALDFSIGEIFSALEAANMLDNSLFIFTTDNGAAVEGIDGSTGSNWPLRGTKYNMWEGGIRGVALIWSSKLRKRHRILNEMMHISDWLPTLYSIAGGKVTHLGKIDGYNLWPTICCDFPSPRDEILYNIDSFWKVEALRKGKFKLLKGSVFDGKFDGWFDKEGKKSINNTPFSDKDLKIQNEVYNKFLRKSQVASIILKKYGDDLFSCNVVKMRSHFIHIISNVKKEYVCVNANNEDENEFYKTSLPIEINCGPKPTNTSTNCKPNRQACVFDIENDPCEYNNLANSFPQVVKELKLLLEKYRSQVVPIRNKPSDPASNPKYHGYAWVPWII